MSALQPIECMISQLVFFFSIYTGSTTQRSTTDFANNLSQCKSRRMETPCVQCVQRVSIVNKCEYGHSRCSVVHTLRPHGPQCSLLRDSGVPGNPAGPEGTLRICLGTPTLLMTAAVL
eukprot:1360812-Rhodomonas_salina.1